MIDLTFEQEIFAAGRATTRKHASNAHTTHNERFPLSERPTATAGNAQQILRCYRKKIVRPMSELHSVVGLPPKLDLAIRVFNHAALSICAAGGWHTFHGEIPSSRINIQDIRILMQVNVCWVSNEVQDSLLPSVSPATAAGSLGGPLELMWLPCIEWPWSSGYSSRLSTQIKQTTTKCVYTFAVGNGRTISITMGSIPSCAQHPSSTL